MLIINIHLSSENFLVPINYRRPSGTLKKGL